MKIILTRMTRFLGVLAIFLLFISPALAQEADNREVNKIEIKDGKVFVNGEMVKELEDSDLRVYFTNEGENGMAFFHGGEDMPFRNFTVAAPHMRELFNDDGNVNWVGDDFEFVGKDFNMAFGNARGNARGNEVLHERIDVLRDGMGENFLYRGNQNSEIRKLERKSQEVARMLSRADDSEKEELNQQLEDLVNEIFGLKLAEQEARISSLSNSLDELQTQLRDRSASRAQIIQRRLSDLRGERDALDW